MRSVAVVVLLAGCGRFGFDDVSTRTSDAGADTMRDGSASVQQAAYLKASNTDKLDTFGAAVAISTDGATLAVGAPQEQSGSPTNQSDNSASSAGAGYVFVRGAAGWSQQAYLKIAVPMAGDLLGSAIAISADGTTIAIASPGSGSYTGTVHVFVRTGASWSEQAEVKAAVRDGGDQFGVSVALSATGDTLIIGAPFEGSSATGVNGNASDNSAAQSGAAYVFVRAGATWSQQAYLKASNTDVGDEFGYHVACASDGNTVAVSAVGEASASAATPADNSLPQAGAVYTFTRAGTTWSPGAYLKASTTDSGAFFGWTLAMSADGTRIAAGIPGDDSVVANSGAIEVLTGAGATWVQEAWLKASNADNNDQLGTGIAMSSDGATIIGGAILEDSASTDPANNSATDSGAAYRFVRTGSTWQQTAYLKASAPDPSDEFGVACTVSGDGRTVAIGAPLDDSNATGIDGDAADNSAQDAGAVTVLYY